MRTFMLAGAAALTLTALPAALNAQTADQANVQGRSMPPTTTVTADPGSATGVNPQPESTTGSSAVVTLTNPGNLTPPPQSAMNKTYPVCTRTLQDNCQNPGEGGAPGRSRALGYWPGEPASERTGRGG